MATKVSYNKKASELKLKERIRDLKRNKKLQKEIGEFTVERLRQFGQAGKPLVRGSKFPQLEGSTILQRAYLAKFNRVDPLSTAEFSNLTFTGQLWKSLGFSVDEDANIIVRFKGKRTPYKTGGGVSKLNKYNKTNEALIEELIKIGFVPFQAKRVETNIRRRVNAIVKKFLRRALRRGERI